MKSRNTSAQPTPFEFRATNVETEPHETGERADTFYQTLGWPLKSFFRSLRVAKSSLYMVSSAALLSRWVQIQGLIFEAKKFAPRDDVS